MLFSRKSLCILALAIAYNTTSPIPGLKLLFSRPTILVAGYLSYEPLNTYVFSKHEKALQSLIQLQNSNTDFFDAARDWYNQAHVKYENAQHNIPQLMVILKNRLQPYIDTLNNEKAVNAPREKQIVQKIAEAE